MPKINYQNTVPDNNVKINQNWVDINTSTLSVELNTENATRHLDVGVETSTGGNAIIDYAELKSGTETKVALAICYYDDVVKKMKPVAYGIVGADIKPGNKLHYAGNLSKINTVNFNEWKDQTKVTDPQKKWYLVGITIDNETETNIEDHSGISFDGGNIYKDKIKLTEELPGDYNQGVFATKDVLKLSKISELKANNTKIKTPFYFPYTEITPSWKDENGKTLVLFSPKVNNITFKPVGGFANIRFKNYLQKNARFIDNKDIYMIYRTKSFASKASFDILSENGKPNSYVPAITDKMQDICFMVNTGANNTTIQSNNTSNPNDDYVAWIVSTGTEDNYSCVIKSGNQADIYKEGQDVDKFSFIELQGKANAQEFMPNKVSQLCMYKSKATITPDKINGKSTTLYAAINSDVLISEVYHCAIPREGNSIDSAKYKNQSLFEFYNPTINNINLDGYGIVRSLGKKSITKTEYAYSKGTLETTVMYSLKDEKEWYPAYYVGNGPTPEKDNLVEKVNNCVVSFGEDKFSWSPDHAYGINYKDWGYGNSKNEFIGFKAGYTAVLLTQQCSNYTRDPYNYKESLPFGGREGKMGDPYKSSGFSHSMEKIKEVCQSIQTCLLTLGGNKNSGSDVRYPIWEDALLPDSPTSATMQHGTYDGYALLKRITYKVKNSNGGYDEVTRYVVTDVYGPSTTDSRSIYNNKTYFNPNFWNNVFINNIDKVIGKKEPQNNNKYERYWATRKDCADFPSIYYNPDNWDYSAPSDLKTTSPTAHTNFKNGTLTIGYRYDGQSGFSSKKP